MKLQQLRYIWEVAHNNLNVSLTAQSLYTSQPGISKQIRLLEDELGVEIFVRNGKHFTQVTTAGSVIIKLAGETLRQVEGIKQVAQEYADQQKGNLALATTYTQAGYVLPKVVKAFMARYPEVVFRMHQATPAQIAEMAIEGSVDFAIASEGLDQFGDFILLPCYRWNHAVIVPKGHLLTKANKMTLELLAQHPLATYVHGFTGRQKLDQAFIDRGLNPKIVFTATNADVIKTYVRMGLGVGIIARMALDSSKDNDFLVVDGENLFTPSVCNIAFRRGTFMRGYMYDFIEYFAPHLTRELVDQAMACHDKPALQQLFQSITLPTR